MTSISIKRIMRSVVVAGVLLAVVAITATAGARPTAETQPVELMAVLPSGQNSVLRENCPSYSTGDGAGAAALSSSGRVVASVCANQSGTEIDVATAPFHSFARVVEDSSQHAQLALTSDGARIAFATDRSGRETLEVVNRSGDHIHSFTPILATPSWAPAGNRLVAQDAQRRIVVVNLRGQTRALGVGDDPSWQPHGSFVAYIGRTGVLVLVSADHQRRFVPQPRPSIDAPLAWSPDGARLAFISGSKGQIKEGLRILVVHSMRERWIGRYLGAIDPIWSPDGKELALLDRSTATSVGWQLVVIKANGTHARVIGNYEPTTQIVGWSHDGQILLITTGPIR